MPRLALPALALTALAAGCWFGDDPASPEYGYTYGRVEGHVRLDDSIGVPDVSVHFGDAGTQRTNADGFYQVDLEHVNLPTGRVWRVRLGALPPGLRLAAGEPAEKPVTVRANAPPARVDWRLDAARGVVAGRVASDAGAVAGAMVRASGRWGARQDTTDADGRFAFDGLVTGAWRVEAFPPAGHVHDVRTPTFRDVTVAEGDTAWAEFAQVALRPGPAFGTVVGRVVAAGQPVVGAVLRLGIRHATTDADGGYRFDAAALDETHVVLESSPGAVPVPYDGHRRAITVSASEETVAHFVLTPTIGAVAGYVRGEAFGSQGAVVSIAGVGTATTTASGSFVLASVPPGEHDVRITLAPGTVLDPPDQPAVRRLVVAPGGTTPTQWLVAGAIGTVRGQVTAGGAPVAGVFVRRAGSGQSDVTDAAGAYEIVGVPAGSQGIEIVPPVGYAVAPGFQRLRVVHVEPRATTVVNWELRAVPSIVVALSPTSVSRARGTTVDVEVRITRPPGVGCVRVEYHGGGWSAGPYPEPVLCGTATTATLQVRVHASAPLGLAAGEVRAVAVDGQGQPTGPEGSAPLAMTVTP